MSKTAASKVPSVPHQLPVEQISTIKGKIENYLSSYKSQLEIINLLKTEENIDARDTLLVWSMLEKQNEDVFYAYGVRLKVKDQVEAFNYLKAQKKKVGD